jgi:hypothetical protein
MTDGENDHEVESAASAPQWRMAGGDSSRTLAAFRISATPNLAYGVSVVRLAGIARILATVRSAKPACPQIAKPEQF